LILLLSFRNNEAILEIPNKTSRSWQRLVAERAVSSGRNGKMAFREKLCVWKALGMEEKSKFQKDGDGVLIT
jgi:hypothetical protein